MKRFISFSVIVLFIIVGLLLVVPRREGVRAQTGSVPSATPPTSQTNLNGITPTVAPLSNVTLTCQGCHGVGKTLPYMAGSLFHKEPHEAYDKSFHSQGTKE